MEASRVKFEEGVQRCPFCHATVSTEADDWVACKQCLARHHKGCWDEGGRCASCQGEVALAADAGRRATPPAGAVLGEVSGEHGKATDAEAVRQTTSRLFDEAERGRARSPVLDGLSFRFSSIGDVLEDFHDHKTRNKAELDPLTAGAPEMAARIDQARKRAVFTTPNANYNAFRIIFSLLVVFPLLAGALVGTAAFPLTHDPGFAALEILCQGILALVFASALHGLRSEVRRHERDQFFVWLVGNAVPPETSKDLLERTGRDWDRAFRLDLGLSALALVPVLGLFYLPALATRVRAALALHEEHEKTLPPAQPPVGKEKA